MLRRSRQRGGLFPSWLAQAGPDARPAALTNAQLPILVVGAGPAGLAAMLALKSAGLRWRAVEGHTHVGGIWDDRNPVSSVYEGLHTVTSRYTSYLGDPVPEDWPNYPSHQQVAEYLQAVGERHGLLPEIQFGTRCEAVTKTARGTWLARLHSEQRETAEEIEVRAIVVATGAHNRRCSAIPEDLHRQALAAGLRVIHSAEYRTAAEFAGQRVLVVGIGNSGSDIAEKISGSAQRTVLAVRTSPWINPATVGGVPCDKLAADGTSLPDWLAMGLFELARRRAIGSFRRLGLARPDYGLNDRLPISDRGIVAAIREGRVIVRSNVREFAEGQAHFIAPGQAPEPFDVVIFATGFSRHYPLLPAPAATDDDLLFHLFHRIEPGLACMTEMIGLRCCWPIFVEQAQALAAYYLAEQRDPRRAADFNALRLRPNPPLKGKLFRLADDYHVDYDIYTQFLHELVDWLGDPRPS
ncbi:MAG: FAD-dependent oxidoreductase [Pirellulales bacterium]|nr:FAD-dependent oxidoreductase [Pirellulales bacterium]